MFRFLLLALTISLAACNTPTTTTTTEEMENTAEETAQGVSSAASETMAELKGDNYVVTTIDGTIKSPRKQLKGTIEGVDVSINYGSPAVNGRTIYGDLVPFGKVWRTGANEATRITFSAPVEVGEEDVELAAGTYALFTLPASKEEWTIIFNKVSDQWGAYDYDDAKDAARISGKAQLLDAPAERMDFTLGEESVNLKWADVMVSFEVENE